MSRQTVKNSLNTLLAATPTISSVYNYMPRNQVGIKFPSIIIALNSTNDVSVTLGNPGRRKIHYEVTLYIQNIDPDPDEQASQQRFDTLLDNIDTQLRSDKTLAGTVLYSAHDKIDTEVFDAQLAGQGISILYRCIKSFEVCVEFMG